jgi:two-component system phosphate regulon sensor histidine kinase PhoR
MAVPKDIDALPTSGAARPARPWLGPVATVGAIAVSEAVNHLVFQTAGPLMLPSVLGLTAVVFSVFHSGLLPGLVSAALLVAHSARYLLGSSPTLSASEGLLRLGLLAVTVPLMVWLVALLKRRTEQLARVEAERGAALAQAAALQAANAALAQQAEELTMQTEELQSQQEELEELTEALRGANAQLEREAMRLGAILDHAVDAIVELDGEGRVIDCNPAAERLFGRVPGLLAELFSPADADAVNRAVSEVIADGATDGCRRLTLNGRGPGGRRIPLAVAIVCVDGFEGPSCTVFLHDLTDERRAEAARRQLDALRQTEALKDQFLGILSHELRTPINAITGFGTILADELAGPLTASQRAYLDKLLGATDALLALVDDLLDMTRIQAGKLSLVAGPARVAEAATGALEAARGRAARKDLSISLELADGLPTVWADEARLRQVIAHLLDNALKFTPAGGRVTLGARADGDGVIVTVQDTGPGIPPEDVPRLFQRFAQLDMTATREAGGLGLGLSICKALVEAHHGRIGVESAPGQGSAFWFWLPSGASAGEAAASPADRQEA